MGLAAWGAGLESLGSGLMKYGMQQISKEEQLAKEARDDARAIERAKQTEMLKIEMEKRAAERYAEKVGKAGAAVDARAKPVDQGLLAGGFEADLVASNEPVKLSREDRQLEVYRELLATDPQAAKEFGQGLTTEANIASIGSKQRLTSLQLLEAADKLDPDSPVRKKLIAEAERAEQLSKMQKLETDHASRTGEKMGTTSAKEVKLSATEQAQQEAVGALKALRRPGSKGGEIPLSATDYAVLGDYITQAKKDPSGKPVGFEPWVSDMVNRLGGAGAVEKFFKDARGGHLAKSQSTTSTGDRPPLGSFMRK